MNRRPDKWLEPVEWLAEWAGRKGCFWWVVAAMALGILVLYLVGK